jgi:hypothetical protein
MQKHRFAAAQLVSRSLKYKTIPVIEKREFRYHICRITVESVSRRPTRLTSIGLLSNQFRSHYSLAYSALAFVRIGMSGSASFHRLKKSSYAAFARAVFPAIASALPNRQRASAPIGSLITIPR